MQRKKSFWRLVGRALLPSGLSLVVTFLAVTLFVAVHLVLLSDSSGVLAPEVFGQQSSQWVAGYHTYVLVPLDKLIHNTAINNFGVALFWLGIGIILTGIVALVVRAATEAHEASKNITINADEGLVRHPSLRPTVLIWAWRFIIIVCLVAGTALLLPFWQELLLRDAVLAQASTIHELLSGMAIVVWWWMLIIHGYIVLLRLFLLRTRISGELIY